MLNLTVGSLFHLIMQLLPFILVSFFVIISIFNWDFRGFVYLVGLGLAVFVSQLMSYPHATDACVDNVGIPIRTNHWVLGYTIGYLFSTIAMIAVGSWTEFMPVITFFTILLLCNIGITTNALSSWIQMPNTTCYSLMGTLVMYGASGFVGLLWAVIINLIDDDNLKFFTSYSYGSRKCKITNNNKYKCNRFINGVKQVD